MAGISARAETAIKHYILIELKPGADQLALDRWYLTFHGPEVRRAFKAWQRNYVSYRSYLPSNEALAIYPLQYGRMTEIQFDSLAAFRKTRVNNIYGGLTSYTPPPGGWRNNELYTTLTATIPVNADRLPVSEPTPPKETPYVRWIIVFEYPENITAKKGDAWWEEEREPVLTGLPGLKRLAFYRSASDKSAQQRVVELWFDDIPAWESASLGLAGKLSAAAWGEPFDDAAMMLVGENPDIDFVNDNRVIP